MNSLYKSETGKTEIQSLYNQKLKHLNINYQYQNIETSFGKTNIIVTGDVTKPPITLIAAKNDLMFLKKK